jgi:two-component system, cell cycle sensor histidine kinase and response regulator CckA
MCHLVSRMKTALKILTVDDNPSITGCMPFIFAAPLYEVSSANDGDDALAKLDGNPNGYDVIIVDQKMPHLSGVELVQGIRERGITGKIVVLSAHLSPQVREAYQQMGVLTVMDKPFNVGELRSAVNELAA